MTRGPFIATHHGRRWYLNDPRVEEVHLDDIAWSLAHSNRFGGHVGIYSTATHSCHVADIVVMLGHHDLELEALLHDAHEAYVGDVSSPLKSLLPDYRRIERFAEDAVREAFGLPPVMHPLVKHADNVACQDEGYAFLRTEPAFSGPYSGMPPMRESALTAMERWLARVNAAMKARRAA